MDYQEVVELLKSANRSNDMVGILPKSDISKFIIHAMQELLEYHKTGLSPKQVADTIFELSATKRVLGHYQQLGTLEEVRDAVEKHKWLPCSERLPEDGDERFYMCIVENHEEDLPMFLQYVEDCGFGSWHDIYDEHTLGFVDSEFRTNEELGYEKVIAWMPLPKPYRPNKCHGCFGAANNDCERCMDGNENY